jgi:ABC-type Fe3+-hydroxamate transport system substrate-binding protein
MDLAIIDKSLRIKTKAATIVVNPLEKSKIEADAALFSQKDAKAEGARLNVTGPGEYEVAGVKISASLLGSSIFYQIEADSLKVGIGRMSEIASNQDKVPSSQIIVVDADSSLNVESIISTEPLVIIAYGQHAPETEKLAGQNVQKLNKFSITFEKLPQETQTVVIS